MAARMGDGGRARALSGVSGGLPEQQPSSGSSSIRGGCGRGKPPMAACEAAVRRTQPGSRWSRPEASQGGVWRAPGGRFDACMCRAGFHRKSWDRDLLI